MEIQNGLLVCVHSLHQRLTQDKILEIKKWVVAVHESTSRHQKINKTKFGNLQLNGGVINGGGHGIWVVFFSLTFSKVGG